MYVNVMLLTSTIEDCEAGLADAKAIAAAATAAGDYRAASSTNGGQWKSALEARLWAKDVGPNSVAAGVISQEIADLMAEAFAIATNAEVRQAYDGDNPAFDRLLRRKGLRYIARTGMVVKA